MTDLIYTLNLGQDFIPQKPKQMTRRKFMNKSIMMTNNAKDLNQALSMSKQNLDSNNINRPQQDQSREEYTENDIPTVEQLQNDQSPLNNMEINNEDDGNDYNSIPVIDANDIQEPRTRRYTNLLEKDIFQNPSESDQETRSTDSQLINTIFPTTMESILSTTTTSILYIIEHVSTYPYTEDTSHTTPTSSISSSDTTTTGRTTSSSTTTTTEIPSTTIATITSATHSTVTTTERQITTVTTTTKSTTSSSITATVEIQSTTVNTTTSTTSSIMTTRKQQMTTVTNTTGISTYPSTTTTSGMTITTSSTTSISHLTSTTFKTMKNPPTTTSLSNSATTTSITNSNPSTQRSRTYTTTKQSRKTTR